MGARALYRQLRAERFPTVRGTVLASAVRASRGSDGDSHDAEVRDRYVVDDRPYEGSTVRHGMKVSGRAGAEAVSRLFPAGSAVAAYYDPADPADAVLSPGLSGIDLFMPMFMLPFNALIIGSWLFAVGRARRVFRPSPGLTTYDGGRAVVTGRR
jgi:hypothetical protein